VYDALPPLPERHAILLVDDEPDMRTVTALGLRTMKLAGRAVEILTAGSGAEAVAAVRDRHDIAVILMDVVMESPTAGLDAIRAIRNEIGNRFVRILLCTGQPGMAPEREVIETYDIDGYLAKGEFTINRLYSTVRSALKAYRELLDLERHRRCLAIVHDCGQSLHSYDPLPETLRRILDAAIAVHPSPRAVLHLSTFSSAGDAQVYTLHAGAADAVAAETAADALRHAVATDADARAARAPMAFAGGVLVPLVVHHELGSGFIHLEGEDADELGRTGLGMLASHAANALYSSIAETMLAARQGKVFDDMSI
jgi:CheY-like chemotaxis protein